MRKLLLIIMSLSLLASSFSAAFAQASTQTPTSCTGDNLSAVTKFQSDISSTLTQLLSQSTQNPAPTDATYGQTLVALDQAVTTYWNSTYPALPACSEAQAVGMTARTVYQAILIAAMLHRAAAWEAANGHPDNQAALEKLAAQRDSEVTATLHFLQTSSVADITASFDTSKLPGCTPDQTAVLVNYFNTFYPAMNAQAAQLMSTPLEVYGAAEAASWEYTTSAVPKLAVCRENAPVVLQINNALISLALAAGLANNTVWEGNAGNNDIAQALFTSANQYLQDFNTQWAALGQQFGLSAATATPEATSGS